MKNLYKDISPGNERLNESNRNTVKRNHAIDFARGIAIIFVVFGHSIQYGSGAAFIETDAFFNNFAFKFIYSFHMPLFALISGYLFFLSLNRKSRTVIDVLKKQFFSLIIPIASWKGIESIAGGGAAGTAR